MAPLRSPTAAANGTTLRQRAWRVFSASTAKLRGSGSKASTVPSGPATSPMWTAM